MSVRACVCVCVHVCVHTPSAADNRCVVVAEPYSGHPQPRSVGHEGEAVPHWSGDQDVGHRLLRHPETVQGGDPQVRINTHSNTTLGPVLYFVYPEYN